MKRAEAKTKRAAKRDLFTKLLTIAKKHPEILLEA